MLQVKNIHVRSFDVDHLDVFWEIGDTFEDPHDYTFIVERSEAPSGPWDAISEPFSDKYYYRDVITNLFHRWRQYWYRIKITKKLDASERYSEVATLAAAPDLVAAEVRRLEMIAFREHIGRLAWIFPVRTFGFRCPACYDRISQTRYRSQCLTCYDTGFAQGYLNPIAQYIQMDPSAKHGEQLGITKTQQQNTTCRLPYFPPLKPKDILVEAENRRWRVERVGQTERLRSVLHQELTLHEIPESDIEYRVPVNIDDLRNLEPSPAREFTNPHNLETVGDGDWFKNILIGHGWSE